MKNKKPEKDKDQQQKKNKAEEKAQLSEDEQKLEDLQKERDDIFAKLQRLSADYANFQKRAPKQIADSVAYEKEKIIKTLLPVLDNFEHTLANARKTDDVNAVVKGIEIVYDQMLGVLKSHDVEKIDAEGDKFDPSMHQAMLQRSEADKEDNIVLDVFQTGYKLNERVIRPSKVVVNKAPEKEDEETEGEDADLEDNEKTE